MNRNDHNRLRRIQLSKRWKPGVAIITVIFMLAIVGLSLAVMARSFMGQAELTARTVARRQLALLADSAVQILKGEVMRDASPRKLQVIALPSAIVRQRGRLTIRLKAAGPGVVAYRIHCRYESLQREFLLAYDRDTGQWIIH